MKIVITFSNGEEYRIDSVVVENLFKSRYGYAPADPTLDMTMRMIGWPSLASYAKPSGCVDSSFNRVSDLDNAVFKVI